MTFKITGPGKDLMMSVGTTDYHLKKKNCYFHVKYIQLTPVAKRVKIKP